MPLARYGMYTGATPSQHFSGRPTRDHINRRLWILGIIPGNPATATVTDSLTCRITFPCGVNCPFPRGNMQSREYFVQVSVELFMTYVVQRKNRDFIQSSSGVLGLVVSNTWVDIVAMSRENRVDVGHY